jgi:hypothetical protein
MFLEAITAINREPEIVDTALSVVREIGQEVRGKVVEINAALLSTLNSRRFCLDLADKTTKLNLAVMAVPIVYSFEGGPLSLPLAVAATSAQFLGYDYLKKRLTPS